MKGVISMDENTLTKLNNMNSIITEYKRGLITYDEFVTKMAFLINACNPDSEIASWDLTDIKL